MEKDFISTIHKSTKRDYLARVNDKEYPKPRAAQLAKKFDYDYWDGDRRVCYGGYKYIPGRWTPIATALIEEYKLTNDSRILDIGCGKGYLMYEIQKLIPGATLLGIDISEYAIQNSKLEVRNLIKKCCASEIAENLNGTFDLAYSINTLHCLEIEKMLKAIKGMEALAKNKYLCVESWRNEEEKANLMYWQVTCEAFHNVNSWKWLLQNSGYTGDYSFIFFE